MTAPNAAGGPLPEHRPTLGSRLDVHRGWLSRPECAAGCGTWPCQAAIEGGSWTGNSPISDGPDEQPPADFILHGKNLFPLNREYDGEPRRSL